MGLMEKFKNMMAIPEEDYYDEMDNVYEEDYRQQEEAVSYEKPRRSSTGGGKVVNLSGGENVQVVLVKPEQFEEARAIADNLNEKKTVVLNLESADREVARRLVDFLSGVAYANAGQLKRVANSTFIITPYNVDVVGNPVEELESGGMFFN